MLSTFLHPSLRNPKSGLKSRIHGVRTMHRYQHVLDMDDQYSFRIILASLYIITITIVLVIFAYRKTTILFIVLDFVIIIMIYILFSIPDCLEQIFKSSLVGSNFRILVWVIKPLFEILHIFLIYPIFIYLWYLSNIHLKVVDILSAWGICIKINNFELYFPHGILCNPP